MLLHIPIGQISSIGTKLLEEPFTPASTLGYLRVSTQAAGIAIPPPYGLRLFGNADAGTTV